MESSIAGTVTLPANLKKNQQNKKGKRKKEERWYSEKSSKVEKKKFHSKAGVSLGRRKKDAQLRAKNSKGLGWVKQYGA